MYYYTKEWYLKSKATGLALNLRHCSSKDMNSREFYEKIFAVFTEEIRFECVQISNTSYDVFAEDRAESEDIVRAEYDRWQHTHLPEDAPFIAAKRLSEKIENLRLILPEEIISQIPDIRIAALGYADEHVTELLEEYADSCRIFMQETDFRFEEEYPARTEPIPDEIWKEYGFKGGSIRKIVRSGTDITVYINNYGSGSDVTAMHLHDCSVERLDDELENAEWIYNEMYLANGMYELHALCRNKKSFPEFIIHTDRIEFEYDR